MKTALFSIIAFVSISTGVCLAEDINIQPDPTKEVDTLEVPVTGDYDKNSKELALKFSECEVYDVAVIGTEGIVFSSKVDVKNYREVRVRIGAYDGEAYTVVVTDSKGRVYEGDFFA